MQVWLAADRLEGTCQRCPGCWLGEVGAQPPQRGAAISLVVSHWELLKCISPTKSWWTTAVSLVITGSRGLALGKCAAFSRKKIFLQWTPSLLSWTFPLWWCLLPSPLPGLQKSPKDRTSCSESWLEAHIIILWIPSWCAKGTMREAWISQLEHWNISNKGYDKQQNKQEIIRLKKTVWLLPSRTY